MKALFVIGIASAILHSHTVFADGTFERESEKSRQIVTAIEDSLRQHPRVGGYRVHFFNEAGKITIQGEAASEQVRRDLETVVAAIDCVTQVDNQIRITPLEGFQRVIVRSKTILSDDAIAEAVRTALQREGLGTRDTIQVSVRNGVVMFKGSQPSFEEIDRILALGLMVDGVRDIRSEMTVQGKEYPHFNTRGARG